MPVTARLVAIVIGMPLAKLQRFGEGRRPVEDRLIYDFSWPGEVGRAAIGGAPVCAAWCRAAQTGC